MAVKNSMAKVYTLPADVICGILRSPDFSKCLDATFIEEAIQPDGIEFRYIRKTVATRYGRNFYIKVKRISEQEAGVSVTTQSRKVTVLFDTAWKREATRAFEFVELLLRRSEKEDTV